MKQTSLIEGNIFSSLVRFALPVLYTFLAGALRRSRSAGSGTVCADSRCVGSCNRQYAVADGNRPHHRTFYGNNCTRR